MACLREAARKDDLDLIKNVGVDDVNPICDHKGITLLHFAAGSGSHRILDYLIEQGVNVNIQDKFKSGPLFNACSHGRLITAKKLISAGADVNMLDSSGYTPLRYAVDNNHLATIKLLLHNGANPALKSIHGNNCFDKAGTPELRDFIWNHYMAYQLRRHIELGNFLGVEKDISEINRYRGLVDRNKICFTKDDLNNSSLLDTATRCLQPSDLLKLIFNLYPTRELLIEAYFEIIANGQIEAVKLLVDSDPTLLNERLVTSKIPSITALHRAAGYGFVDIALYLLDKGANPNEMDTNGSIPLHYASCWDHLEIAKLLIDRGSDIDKADRKGHTPLHDACQRSKIQICKLLIDSGALRHSQDIYGNTPYQLATDTEIKNLLTESPLSAAIDKEIYLPFVKTIETYSSPQFTYQSICEDDHRLMIDFDLTTIPNSRTMNHYKLSLVTIKKEDEIFRLIKNKMHETIRYHENGPIFTHYDIKSVIKILNEKNFHDYKLRREKIKAENNGFANERLLYHGSPNVERLIPQGFDESYASSAGMFGPGLYFARDSSKSNQYTFGLNRPCSIHNDKSCYKCKRKILLCQVALGNSKKVKEVCSFSHAPIGHHSVSALPEILGKDILTYPEYIIYRGEQAYPLYLIEYKILNIQEP